MILILLLIKQFDVYCIFVTFPYGILGQVWYSIVSFPDLCRISYFENVSIAHFYCFMIALNTCSSQCIVYFRKHT